MEIGCQGVQKWKKSEKKEGWSSAETKNEQGYTSTPSTCLHGVGGEKNLPFRKLSYMISVMKFSSQG